MLEDIVKKRLVLAKCFNAMISTLISMGESAQKERVYISFLLVRARRLRDCWFCSGMFDMTFRLRNCCW